MQNRGTEQNNKVFVGSIPAYYRKNDVLRVFTGCRVSKVKLDYKRDSPHLNKGFCVLTMESPQDALMLLAQRVFEAGGGRYLVCKPFLQGPKLQEEILRHEERRLILKQLPLEVSENSLKEHFEEHVGPVEIVFIYKPDEESTSTHVSRKWRTASVTLSSHQDVHRLFSFDLGRQETIIYVGGHPVTAQRFKMSKEGEKTVPVLSHHAKKSRQCYQEPIIGYQKKNFFFQQVVALEQALEPHIYGTVATSELNHEVENIRFNLLSPKRQLRTEKKVQSGRELPGMHERNRHSAKGSAALSGEST